MIIHRAEPHNIHPRQPPTNSIQQRPTLAAEVIRHLTPALDALALRKRLELILAPLVRKRLVAHVEVGCEHGRCDFAAVGAVADGDV